MIIGEFEVLGQVRHALETAEKARMVNLPLRNMFQSAIRTGRRVREETGISKNALSVSSVAVELATKAVGDVARRKILIIGAGEAGKLVAKAAKERGASNIVVTSRSHERASSLAAALDGTSVSLNNLTSELINSNIIVTCAGAPHRILDFCRVEEAMKNRQELPLVIIDIAVPRNVEPTVGQINNVFLYNIDDLTEISESNRKQREGEIQNTSEIIAAEVANFVSWWQALKVRPVVSALMAKAEDIRRAQLNKTLKKLNGLSDEERHRLEAMTKSIVTKILKDPIYCLKANANDDINYGELVVELFQLNTEREE
jgi:glutamyl-tRNA reductase